MSEKENLRVAGVSPAGAAPRRGEAADAEASASEGGNPAEAGPPLRAKSWPPYYGAKVFIGNPESDLAICTGWSDPFRLADQLGDAARKVAVIGALRSVDGLNFLLRNWAANPRVRRIIVVGVPGYDYSSTEFLRVFSEQGLNPDRTLPGVQFETKARIQAEIPDEVITTFRENVTIEFLHESREPVPIADLAKKIDTEAGTGALLFEPKVFPLPEVRNAATVPTAEGSFSVTADGIFDAWVKVLGAATTVGWEIFVPGKSKTYLQLPTLAVTVTKPARTPEEAAKFPDGNYEKLEHYATNSILSPAAPEGVDYSYGSLLHAWGPDRVNQIQRLADGLRAKPLEREIAVLWAPEKHLGAKNPPCLVLVQPYLHRDRLCVTALFRSHNLARAWYENAWGIAALQDELAELSGIPAGTLTLISQVGRMDMDFLGEAEDILRKHWKRGYDPDPRGSFQIEVDREAGKIIVTHFSAEREVLGRYEGGTAMAVQGKIAPLFGNTFHAIDIGIELGKAEACLRAGWEYVQDRPLPLGK